jgi:hypothetical protein
VTQDLPGQPADNSNIVATTTTGGPAVFYVDATGRLAESSEQSGTWTSRALVPDSPALSPASLALADTAAGPVLFGVGPAGTIRAASAVSGAWSSRAVPARTTAGGSLAALTAQGGQAAVVYVDAHGGGLAEAAATSGTTAGAWHVTGLPGSPAPGSGLAATTYLLPAAVSGPLGSFPSFATAWDDTLSGGYLVISVGQAATGALYYNACGWANPSVDIPGSTPFYDVTGPWDTLPGAGAFENAAAATASLAQQRVTGLAYYAVHGTLPPGVTSVPAAASAVRACSGSPS